MSISADIRNLKNPMDKERKLQDYKDYIQLQKKLNASADVAFKALAKGQSMGITPVAPMKKYASVEEAMSDISEQRLIALNHLKTLFPYGEDATKALDTLDVNSPVGAKGSELTTFNSYWTDFENEIKGVKNLTLPFFERIWTRYKVRLARTKKTGIELPVDDTSYKTELNALGEQLKNTIQESGLTKKKIQQIVDGINKAVSKRDDSSLEGIKNAIISGNEELLNRVMSKIGMEENIETMPKPELLVYARKNYNFPTTFSGIFKFLDKDGNEQSVQRVSNASAVALRAWIETMREQGTVQILSGDVESISLSQPLPTELSAEPSVTEEPPVTEEPTLTEKEVEKQAEPIVKIIKQVDKRKSELEKMLQKRYNIEQDKAREEAEMEKLIKKLKTTTFLTQRLYAYRDKLERDKQERKKLISDTMKKVKVSKLLEDIVNDELQGKTYKEKERIRRELEQKHGTKWENLIEKKLKQKKDKIKNLLDDRDVLQELVASIDFQMFTASEAGEDIPEYTLRKRQSLLNQIDDINKELGFEDIPIIPIAPQQTRDIGEFFPPSVSEPLPQLPKPPRYVEANGKVFDRLRSTYVEPPTYFDYDKGMPYTKELIISDDGDSLREGIRKIYQGVEEEKGGRGFRHDLKLNRKILYGRGISKSNADRYKEFGRYIIHIPSLKKSILNIKFKSKGYIPQIPTTHISEELRQMIEEVLETQRLPVNIFSKLSRDEQKLFENVAQLALIDDVLGLKVDNTEKKEAMKRFEILKGELLAGNDSEEIRRELRSYILRFMNENLIPRKEGMNILMEMACLA